MTRTLSADFRDFVEASSGEDVVVIFATITHPSLLEPVPVCSDVVDYVYNGQTYLGSAFKMRLLNDDENVPKASVSIQNVDEEIGEGILALSSAPSIRIEILLKSDFDDAVPRAPIGTPVPEYVADQLSLQNVQCDAMTLSADLVGQDLSTEPWPAIRSTQDRLPGLYR